MALTSSYTEAYGKLGEFFNKLRDAQVPPQFTQQFLIDLGFKSNKQRAYIPLLKSLGFLTPEGKPTARYKEYRDHSQSKKVMAEAIKEAYADIFLIKELPTSSDASLVEGKFKSYHNCSDNVAVNMRRTFFALLELADLSKKTSHKKSLADDVPNSSTSNEDKSKTESAPINVQSPALHYNIQIHLPATKDIEVYNAIFKSLKEHLF